MPIHPQLDSCNAQYRNTSLHLLQILPCTHPIAGFELTPIAFLGDDVEDFAAGVQPDLFGERGGRFADVQLMLIKLIFNNTFSKFNVAFFIFDDIIILIRLPAPLLGTCPSGRFFI